MARQNLTPAGHTRGGFRTSLFVLIILLLGISGCMSAPEGIIGVDNPVTPAETVKGLKRHDIFIMTSRALDNDPAVFYSGERSQNLGLAKVTVTVPPNHVSGAIERPSSLPPKPEKEFTIVDPRTFSSESAMTKELGEALNSLPKGDRTILLFVHGYNTTLADAVLRLAQFTEDTDFNGIPVLFSWASGGKLFDYVYDLNSALQARDDLLRSARLLAETNAEGFNIVAHSMGNFLTVEAMRQAKLLGTFDRNNRVRNFIFASPDIDVDVFAQQLKPFSERERSRFFVLISADDKALSFSSRIAGGVNRVGAAEPDELAKLGVTVIDLTKIEDSNDLNHSKFSDSPAIVKLIGKRLEAGGSLETGRQKTDPVGDAAAGLAILPVRLLSGGGRIVVFQ